MLYGTEHSFWFDIHAPKDMVKVTLNHSGSLIIGFKVNLINAFSGSSTISISLYEYCPSWQWELHYKKENIPVLIPGHHSRPCPLLEVEKLKMALQLTVRIPAGLGTV